MAKLHFAVVAFVVLAGVATAALISFSGLPHMLMPQATPTPSPTVQPTAAPTAMFTPGLKSAVFTRLTLDSNDSFTLRGYLAAGGERETAYIGNATVYVYDADNGTLYAQTATTNSVDSQRLLDIGGFSVKLPQSDHSYHIYIEFKGNSQYAPCISQTLTVNSVSDITLQYFQ